MEESCSGSRSRGVADVEPRREDDVAEGHRLREGRDSRLLASLRLAVEPQRSRLVAMCAGCLLHLELRAVHDHVRHRACVTGAEAVVLLEPGEDLAVLGEALRGGLVYELLRGLAVLASTLSRYAWNDIGA